MHINIFSKEALFLIKEWCHWKRTVFFYHCHHVIKVIKDWFCHLLLYKSHCSKPQCKKRKALGVEPFCFVFSVHTAITTIHTSPLHLSASISSEWNPWEWDPYPWPFISYYPARYVNLRRQSITICWMNESLNSSVLSNAFIL